jgi:PAS domain S-box-containing protein
MREKVCFIAPYPELAALAYQVKGQSRVDFMIETGNLEEAIPVALDAQRDGTQVIVSRGGTAALLRRYVDIPVVEIYVTGYDVLKALYPYRDGVRKIAVVGYRNVVYGCRTVIDMLGITAAEFIIRMDDEQVDWSALRHRLQQTIKEKSIEIIVGDTIGVSLFRADDVAIELITSGKEAILQALEEAAHVIQVREEEKKNAERFQTVLNFVHDGVMATDERGVVTVFNPAAEQIFGIEQATIIGKPVQQIIANTRVDRVLSSGVPEIEQLQQLDVGHILTNRVPIHVDGELKGVVATFQEVSQIQRTEQKIRQNLYAKGLYAKYAFHDILSVDPQMSKLKEIAQNYAGTDATILIRGESGTGKELFAQSIHRNSQRAKGPFVAVNCSALPVQILESELFGYEEGAFTGAKKGGKTGLFELAHGGTIFLDEIGDMDKGLQSRLLRVIEEKQVMRIASDTVIPVDIRVIAATNMDLRDEVSRGNFRLDLYYRLNVLNLTIPPLRQRRKDVQRLMAYYLATYCDKYGRRNIDLPEELAGMLNSYDWPGNVRELRNIAERIVLSAENGIVTPAAVKILMEELSGGSTRHPSRTAEELLFSGTLYEIKAKVVREIVKQEQGNKTKAAKRLGIDRATVDRLIQ